MPQPGTRRSKRTQQDKRPEAIPSRAACQQIELARPDSFGRPRRKCGQQRSVSLFELACFALGCITATLAGRLQVASIQTSSVPLLAGAILTGRRGVRGGLRRTLRWPTACTSANSEDVSQDAAE